MTLSGASPPLSLGHWMLHGSVGSVLYYDRAVTASEASTIHCAFSVAPRNCTCNGQVCTTADALAISGAVSYWPLDRDGSDAVGANHLTEVNGPIPFTPGAPSGPRGAPELVPFRGHPMSDVESSSQGRWHRSDPAQRRPRGGLGGASGAFGYSGCKPTFSTSWAASS